MGKGFPKIRERDRILVPADKGLWKPPNFHALRVPVTGMGDSLENTPYRIDEPRFPLQQMQQPVEKEREHGVNRTTCFLTDCQYDMTQFYFVSAITLCMLCALERSCREFG